MLDRLLEAVADLHPELLALGRDQGRRSRHRDRDAHLPHAEDVGARHPAVSHVAHDRDVEALQMSLLLPDGHEVEQGLSRMLVRPVARVDHPAAQAAGEQRGRPGGLVAHHHHVRAHGLDVAGGVEQALTLLRARAGGGEVDDVGGEPLARDLERGPGAGGGLVEEIHHRLPPKRRDLLDLAGGDLLHGDRGVEHVGDLRRLQLLHADQILALPAHGAHSSWMTTRSTPSCSRSSTATDSRRLVGRFLPM